MPPVQRSTMILLCALLGQRRVRGRRKELPIRVLVVYCRACRSTGSQFPSVTSFNVVVSPNFIPASCNVSKMLAAPSSQFASSKAISPAPSREMVITLSVGSGPCTHKLRLAYCSQNYLINFRFRASLQKEPRRPQNSQIKAGVVRNRLYPKL